MSYKIAIGSSDKINVDLKFGEVKSFLIYEVDEEVKLIENRKVNDEENNLTEIACGSAENSNKAGCGGAGGGCGAGSGCGGAGNGCKGPEEVISKVSLISDCRCVVCKKIGFQAQKQFEKKAISVFDVDCTVAEALKKITFYYNKIDNHKSFRKE
jgi:predicted Fe-Mo cluster-binding NifX family protein